MNDTYCGIPCNPKPANQDAGSTINVRQMPSDYCWQGIYAFVPNGWDDENQERPMTPVRVLKWEPGQRIVPVMDCKTGQKLAVATAALWREIDYSGRTAAHTFPWGRE